MRDGLCPRLLPAPLCGRERGLLRPLQFFRTGPRNIVKEVALGGLLAGLSAFLFGIASFVDFSGLFIYLAATPLVTACILYGVPYALQVAAASTLLVSLWLAPFPTGLHYLMTQVPLGVSFGWCERTARGLRVTLLLTVAVLSVTQGAVFLVDLFVLGIRPENFLGFFARALHVPEEAMMRWSLLLYPAFIFLYSLCFTVYIWFFNTVVLARIGLIERRQSPLLEIPALMNISHAPLLLLFPAAASLLLARFSPWSAWSAIGWNTLAILLIFCYVKGFFLYNRKLRVLISLAGPLRIPLVILAFVFSVTAGVPLLALAGLLSFIAGAVRGRPAPLPSAPPAPAIPAQAPLSEASSRRGSAGSRGGRPRKSPGAIRGGR